MDECLEIYVNIGHFDNAEPWQYEAMADAVENELHLDICFDDIEHDDYDITFTRMGLYHEVHFGGDFDDDLYEAILTAIEEIGDENKPGFDALMESDNYSAVLQSAYDAVFNAVSEAVQDALVETANEVDSDYSIDDCTPDNLISCLGEALHDAVLSGAGYGR